MSQLTDEQKRNLHDPIWRISNLYHINAKGIGKRPFTPYVYQTDLLKEIFQENKLNHIIIKVRQKGFSTLFGIICLDQALFTKDFRCTLVDQTAADAEKKMTEIIRFAWENAKWADAMGLKLGRHDSAGMMSWEHGSIIYAGKRPRGGANDILWVSEWGPIQYNDPVRSKEIKTGGLPSALNGLRIVETTWMGGKHGDLWELTKDAMETAPENKTERDWWFHFAPWYDDPRNRLKGNLSAIDPDTMKYLEESEERLGFKFDDDQKVWYWKTKREQGDDMGQEYPTFAEEAFTKAVPDAIFAKWVAKARDEGRIMDFRVEKGVDVMTFWDIGKADLMAVWFIQVVSREIRLLKCYQNHHQTWAHYIDVIRRFERDHDVMCTKHFLPHDGARTSLRDGKSRKQILDEFGIGRFEVVKQPRSLWDSIDNVRDRMGSMYFNRQELSVSPRIDDKDYPSPMDCLETYHSRPVESGRVVTKEPVHDNTSHVCDALRTFGDAWAEGMIEGLPSRDGREPMGSRTPKMKQLPKQAIGACRRKRERPLRF